MARHRGGTASNVDRRVIEIPGVHRRFGPWTDLGRDADGNVVGRDVGEDNGVRADLHAGADGTGPRIFAPAPTVTLSPSVG